MILLGFLTLVVIVAYVAEIIGLYFLNKNGDLWDTLGGLTFSLIALGAIFARISAS